jgi:lysine 2,3-aminomutase
MSWTNEVRSALKSTKELGSFFNIKELESLEQYPVFIPIAFAAHIRNKKSSALNKQFLPDINEINLSGGFIDPIGDSKNSQGSGIIHRYKNRILFSPTTKCPIICRYCFRKNELYADTDIFKSSLKGLSDYLLKNKDISEVVLTGGDPFFISNSKIKSIFEVIENFSQIKHIRFHTRFPIIIPSRFDDELLEIMNECSKKIIIAIHSNHIDEFSEHSETAIKKLSSNGITLISQSVLLKGVNDSSCDLLNLFNKFEDLSIRPYYLHHPDQVKGAMHFYMNLETGRKIYSKLRDKISGWLLPHYVIDNFLGQGKQLAFNPESIRFSGQMLDKSNNMVDFVDHTQNSH